MGIQLRPPRSGSARAVSGRQAPVDREGASWAPDTAWRKCSQGLPEECPRSRYPELEQPGPAPRDLTTSPQRGPQPSSAHLNSRVGSVCFPRGQTPLISSCETPSCGPGVLGQLGVVVLPSGHAYVSTTAPPRGDSALPVLGPPPGSYPAPRFSLPCQNPRKREAGGMNGWKAKRTWLLFQRIRVHFQSLTTVCNHSSGEI